ncbi:MAG TPA: DNA-3-methyladenine glycosylase [Anaerolineaceae bacterium]|nr:DNA-3-methyladenine glycosylase [Anaerolineaceae bacterium]
MPTPLPPSFYDRDVVETARALLGMRLVRRLEDGTTLSGIITETEAYRGQDDQACHARNGRTRRNAVMFGPPGRAYVYFTYGMHWCLNVVAGPDGFPAAVLLRAIHPLEGLDFIALRRARAERRHWTNGPAKLTQALAIDGALNGCDLTDPASPLCILPGTPPPAERITAGARVGLGATPEPWLSMPWRFTFPLELEQ